jgi:hypothetical protein
VNPDLRFGSIPGDSSAPRSRLEESPARFVERAADSSELSPELTQRCHVRRSFTMTDPVQAERSAKILPFPGRRPIAASEHAEREVEFRLKMLGILIQSLMNAPYPSLLREREAIREALEELMIKETTLRWIVRVTKSTEGAVREKLWADIERAVTDLERIADSVMQPLPASRRAL